MFETRTIKHCKQDVADTDRDIAEKRHEARTLLGIPREKRTAAHRERLDTLDADLTALTAKAAELARERAQFERVRDDEIRQGNADGLPAAERARSPRFGDLFPNASMHLSVWRNEADFLAATHKGIDPRLLEHAQLHAANSVGDSSTGGASVPTVLLRTWLDSALEEPDSLRALCAPFAMPSSVINVPSWDDSDHSDGTLYGGMAAQWLSETGSMTVSTPLMQLLELRAWRLGILCRFSNELLSDGQGYREQISMKMPKAAGWFTDYAILRGSGVGRPLGVLNSSATITVSKENGQQAATLTYQNLADMWARLQPGAHQQAVWVINQSALPELLTLSIPIGTAGSHVPVLNEQSGTYRIFGARCIFTEKASALGQRGDVLLANFGAYAFGLRQDATLDWSGHVGFTSNETYARLILRCDGMPTIAEPLQPANGSTVSPFVTLEART